MKKNKIDDFGEYLEGAHKDRLLNKSEMEVEGNTLSSIWPLPDYKKLLESGCHPWNVGMARALRESVSRKPPEPTGRRRSRIRLLAWEEYFKNWKKEVLSKKITASFFLEEDNSKPKKDIVDISTSKELKMLATTASIYETLGHERTGLKLGNFFLKFEPKTSSYHSKEGWRIMPYDGKVNFNEYYETYETMKEAISTLGKIEERFAQRNKTIEKKNKFRMHVNSWRNDPHTYRIFVKIGPRGTGERKTGYITFYSSANRSEITERMEREREDLERKVRQWKKIPFHRKKENDHRKGKDHRNGASVTPEKFMETFAPRGVQFGNYVNNKQRQEMLNSAYDALCDLAEVLNVQKKSLFLNSTLGLAFGARGKGGINAPLAHYESDKKNINLTKSKGAGSLAHEWFHAFDYYAGRKAGDIRIERGRELPGALSQGKRSVDLKPILEIKGLLDRSKELDELRRSKQKKQYWSKEVEIAARAFESFVKSELAERNSENDFLVNILPLPEWTNERPEEKGNDYPYIVSEEEMKIAKSVFPKVIGKYLPTIDLQNQTAHAETMQQEKEAEPTAFAP